MENVPQKKLRVRDVFRKVDFDEYKNSCTKELLQQFLDGKLGLETPIETLRGIMFGYTFTEDYVNNRHVSPFSIQYWEDVVDFGENIPNDWGEKIDDEVIVELCQNRIDQIVDTLLSTGDGKSPGTAFCVIDTYQEYELMREIFTFGIPEKIRQSLLEGGIDCIEFASNEYGVEKLYFDVHRRFEVGYPFKRNGELKCDEIEFDWA